jgi:anaphase-promoting complex subunit 10
MTRVHDQIIFTSINLESFVYLRPYILKWLQAATQISIPNIVIQEYETNENHEDAAEQPQPIPTTPPAPPPGLKEISSLASWTVSSSKPGCGVQALRAPNTQLFWQSDGPQPHHLNIHFFKMVSIVGMRIYLDFELDESYTPTLIRFAAGTGYADLQEFSVMRFEQPRGWLDVDFEGVGDPRDDNEEGEDGISKLPVLRAMLVQVRICENHQNGKDTHLRGLQIFARDEEMRRRRGREMKSGAKLDIGEGLAIRTKKGVWEMPEWAEVPSLR